MIREDTLRYLIPRLREMVVSGQKLFLYLDNAEYTVTCLDAAAKSTTRISIMAIFRENSLDSGGSWWQHWYVNCNQADSALFTTFIAGQINQSMARFARILEETREPPKLAS